MRQRAAAFEVGEVGGSLVLSAYAVKARASLSHSKAPASDPSARLRAGGGRYKGGERFLVMPQMSGMNVRPPEEMSTASAGWPRRFVRGAKSALERAAHSGLQRGGEGIMSRLNG